MGEPVQAVPPTPPSPRRPRARTIAIVVALLLPFAIAPILSRCFVADLGDRAAEKLHRQLTPGAADAAAPARPLGGRADPW